MCHYAWLSTLAKDNFINGNGRVFNDLENEMLSAEDNCLTNALQFIEGKRYTPPVPLTERRQEQNQQWFADMTDSETNKRVWQRETSATETSWSVKQLIC